MNVPAPELTRYNPRGPDGTTLSRARIGTTPPDTATAVLPADVAASLREARERRGWSIRRAGRELRTPHTTLLRLESGARLPSVAMAAALADAYDLDGRAAARLYEVALPNVGRSNPYRVARERAGSGSGWRRP